MLTFGVFGIGPNPGAYGAADGKGSLHASCPKLDDNLAIVNDVCLLFMIFWLLFMMFDYCS